MTTRDCRVTPFIRQPSRTDISVDKRQFLSINSEQNHRLNTGGTFSSFVGVHTVLCEQRVLGAAEVHENLTRSSSRVVEGISARVFQHENRFVSTTVWFIVKRPTVKFKEHGCVHTKNDEFVRYGGIDTTRDRNCRAAEIILWSQIRGAHPYPPNKKKTDAFLLMSNNWNYCYSAHNKKKKNLVHLFFLFKISVTRRILRPFSGRIANRGAASNRAWGFVAALHRVFDKKSH